MTPSGVFDFGNQTVRALRAIEAGTPELEAAPSGERSNGNGSLMRVLPLALWHRGSDAELVADAHLQSRVTHPHVRSQVCCALYCLWARRELAGKPYGWASAVTALREVFSDFPGHSHELETKVRPDDPPWGNGTGYVVDCLHSARLVSDEGTFEATVKAAVELKRRAAARMARELHD